VRARVFLWLLAAGCLVVCVSKASEVNATGKWIVSESVSEMDDTKTIVLSLPAETQTRGVAGKAIYPSLNIRWEENKLDIYFNLGVIIGGSSDQPKCRVRLDRRYARTLKFNISTDYRGMFWRGNPEWIIRDLLMHENLCLEFEPYGKSIELVKFDLRGLVSVISSLAEAAKLPYKTPALTENEKVIQDVLFKEFTTGFMPIMDSTCIRDLEATIPHVPDYDYDIPKITNALSKVHQKSPEARFLITEYRNSFVSEQDARTKALLSRIKRALLSASIAGNAIESSIEAGRKYGPCLTITIDMMAKKPGPPNTNEIPDL